MRTPNNIMNCSQEISAICRICLAVNVKIYNIINSRLQALYKNILCAEFEFDFELDIGVDFGACYICYAQLLKIHIFSELAQSSGKRLQYLKDLRVVISSQTFDFYNLHTQHNLSINVIPPISIQSNSNITEINVIKPLILKKEHIKRTHGPTDNCEKSNCCVIEHPELTMPQAISQTQNTMRTKKFIVNENLQEGSAYNYPISEEYVENNPVSVKEEYFEYEYNTADDRESLNSFDIEYPTITMPPDPTILTQSQTKTKTFDGTQIKQEDCALSKPVAEINAANLVSFKEEYIGQEHNTTDDCETSNNCDIEYLTLTMSPDPIGLIQSTKQTETFVGTKRIREECAVSNLKEQQKGKTEVNEFGNDIAVTNTPITRNMLKARKRKDLAKSNGDLEETKIDELIQMLIKIHKESIITKKLHETSQKEPAWCNRSQEILIQLIRLAGSERSGAMLLADRVFPLFPQGFMRLPTLSSLLRMAGYKKTKKLDGNEHEDVVFDSKLNAEKSIDHRLTSCKSIKTMPSLALRDKQSPKLTVETSPALLLPSSKITKFSLNHVLNVESKKDTKGFVPVNIMLHNKIVKFKGSKSTAATETVNEVMQQNSNFLRKQEVLQLSQQDEISADNDLQVTSMFSLAPKDTDKISKCQEQNIVRKKNKRISPNKEGQKLAQINVQPSEAEVESSVSAVSKNSANVLKAMLNKFSKFKEKLDSQDVDLQLENSSDVEIIEND